MWEYSVEDLECLYRNSSPEDREELLQEILTAATRGEAEVRWVLDSWLMSEALAYEVRRVENAKGVE